MGAGATDGFSLIETLVAMSVLAVSSSVILSAAEAHTRSVTAVTERTLARWVAQNAMTELEMSGAATPSLQLGGIKWIVRLERSPTTDPDLERADVLVATAPEPDVVLARLSGFVVAMQGGAQ